MTVNIFRSIAWPVLCQINGRGVSWFREAVVDVSVLNASVMPQKIDSAPFPPPRGAIHVWLVDVRAASRGTHDALRIVLPRYGGALSQLRFAAHGKPEFADGRLLFNASRSRNIALVAVGECEVGIDVECTSSEVDNALIEWIAPGASQLDFLAGWTRVEAFHKARGDGLPDDPRDFHSQSRDPCWIHTFSPKPGYIASLAVPDGPRCIEFFHTEGIE